MAKSGKGKSKESTNDEDITGNSTKPQYRCGLTSIVDTFKLIRLLIKRSHVELWRKTPFRLMLDSLYEGRVPTPPRVRGQLYEDLISSYNKGGGGFKIGGHHYKPNVRDVQLIFGIDDGLDDVGDPSIHGKDGSEFGPRLFGNVSRIGGKEIKERLQSKVELDDETSVQDTVKLLILLIFQSVFFTNTGVFIGWGYCHYLHDLTRLSRYNWSAHILSVLQTSLDGNWGHPSKVTGSIVFLLFWFCEHCGLAKSIADTVPIEGAVGGQGNVENTKRWIPRLTKWKLENIGRELTKDNLRTMESKSFRGGWLSPTLAEISHFKCIQKARGMGKNKDVEKDSDDDDIVVVNEEVDSALRKKSAALKKCKATVSGEVPNTVSEDGSALQRGQIPSFKLGVPGVDDLSPMKVNEVVGNIAMQYSEKGDVVPDSPDRIRQVEDVKSLKAKLAKQKETQHTLESRVRWLEKEQEKSADVLKDSLEAFRMKMQNEKDVAVQKVKSTVLELTVENKRLADALKKTGEGHNIFMLQVDEAVAKQHALQEENENLKAAKVRLSEKLKASEDSRHVLEVKMKDLEAQIIRNKEFESMAENTSEFPVVKSEKEGGVIEMTKKLKTACSHLKATLVKRDEKIANLENELKDLNAKLADKNVLIQDLEKEIKNYAPNTASFDDSLGPEEAAAMEEEVHAVTQRYGLSVQEEHKNSKKDKRETTTVEPSSMVLRMKTRGPRKKRMEDDQYEYDMKGKRSKIETVDITIDDNTMDNSTDVVKAKLRTNKNAYACGKYVHDEVYRKLVQANEIGGRMQPIVDKRGIHDALVHLSSVVNVLNNDCIDSSIIDWFVVSMSEVGIVGKKLHVVTAGSWAALHDYEKAKNYDNTLVANIIDNLVGGKDVYFPLCCPGRRKDPYHWVLLTYNNGLREWNLYNPLFVRRGTSDPFIKDCQKLISYVSTCMKNYEIELPWGVDPRKVDVIKVENIPLQSEESVDCGVYVMYYIMMLAGGTDMNVKFGAEHVLKFKGELVNTCGLQEFAIKI